MFIIRYREEGHAVKQITYNTEKGMMKKLKELSDNPLVISVRIFKEITYGEQKSLFDSPDKLPY